MKTEILMMHTSQSIIKLCSTVEYLVVKCTFEFFIDFQVNSWFFLVCSRSTTQKSNLHYTRHITPKRVTNSRTHLRSAAPGRNSSEQTSQRWRVDLIIS